MRRRTARFPLVLFATLLAASAALSAQMTSTPVRAMGAVMQTGGFMIRPAGVAPAAAGDLAPQQLFEIVRPGDQPIAIGRMFTSCACIRLEADSRSFGQGERAVLRLRNVIATPPAGQTYSVFIQLTSPAIATLRYDTYVQSSQFVPSADGLQPTRGDIVADGVLTGDEPVPDEIEIIVPRADDRVPDESKQALQETPGDNVHKEVEKKSAPAETSLRPPPPAPAPVPAPARSETTGATAGSTGSGDSLWRDVAPRTRTRPVFE